MDLVSESFLSDEDGRFSNPQIEEIESEIAFSERERIMLCFKISDEKKKLKAFWLSESEVIAIHDNISLLEIELLSLDEKIAEKKTLLKNTKLKLLKNNTLVSEKVNKIL